KLGIVTTCVCFLRSKKFTTYFRSHVCMLLNLLARGNNEAKRRICKSRNLTSLFQDITSFSSGFYVDVPDEFIVMVEQTTSLLQTLTFRNIENQKEVMKFKLDHLIHVCDVYGLKGDSNERNRFSDEATELLRKLTQDKVLVGSLKRISIKDDPSIFKQLPETVVSVEVIYGVDLFDTTSDQDVKISDELLKHDDIVWPAMERKLINIEVKITVMQETITWCDLVIKNYIDGQYFWAQILNEDTKQNIRILETVLKYKDPLQQLVNQPRIGDWIIASPCKDGWKKLYRAVVLNYVTPVTILVQSLDYGFTERLPWKQQYDIPPSLVSIPAQVILCKLFGVHAPPISTAVVCNTLGILENLSQNINNAPAIVNTSNLDVIVQLICKSPDVSICCKAAGILLNCARNIKLRGRIGRNGGISALCDLYDRFLTNDSVLFVAMGALRNLLYECPANCKVFTERDGLVDCLQIIQSTSSALIKEQTLGVEIRSVLDAENKVDCLKKDSLGTMNAVLDKEETKRSVPMQTLQLVSSAPDPSHCSIQTRSLKDYHHPNNGQNSGSLATIVKDHYHDEETKNRCGCKKSRLDTVVVLYKYKFAYGLYSAMTIEESVASSISISHSDSNLINAAQVTVRDESLPFYVCGMPTIVENDDTHDIRPLTEVQKISYLDISEIVCAFLNSGRGGTIYFGLCRNGVYGITANRSERDQLRLGVDRLMVQMIPSVTHNKYNVVFAPVVEVYGYNSPKTRRQIQDSFVIEIHIFATCGTIYTTSKSNCYFRHGTKNIQYSHQDVHEMVILAEENNYITQIQSLEADIKKLES
ncbi:uncharacterized protein LOC144351907, partial [Saccoglossus kowalevskii]